MVRLEGDTVLLYNMRTPNSLGNYGGASWPDVIGCWPSKGTATGKDELDGFSRHILHLLPRLN